MLDRAGLEVVLLMNVAVEHGDVVARLQDLDRLGPVRGGPVPLRVEVEQRPMREYDDARVFRLALEVGLEPGELLVSDRGAGIGYIVDRDEVHALVIEGPVRLAEEILERSPFIERGVVLAGHELDVLDLELLDDVA